MNTRNHTMSLFDYYAGYYARPSLSKSLRDAIGDGLPKPEPPKTEEIVFKKPVKYFL